MEEMEIASWGLPHIVARHIVEYLCIDWVRESEVRVVNCSSTAENFPISEVLTPATNTWWISEAIPFPPGATSAGSPTWEYLDFEFGAVPRRVSFIGVKIPPLSIGPLSVRRFHLLARRNDAAVAATTGGGGRGTTTVQGGGDTRAAAAGDDDDDDDDGSWVEVGSWHMQTLNLAELQEFAIVPAMETRAVRLVATMNASEAQGGIPAFTMKCIGLYQVAFA